MEESLSPLVSVVIPSYNRAALLPRAITSVLTQTFSDLECIVVDDGSTDQTEQVVAEFQDPRLRVIRLPDNGGGAAPAIPGFKWRTVSLSPSWIATMSGCPGNSSGR